MLWGKLKMNSARDHHMRAEIRNKRTEDICTDSRTPDTVRASFGHVSRSQSRARAAAGGTAQPGAERCPTDPRPLPAAHPRRCPPSRWVRTAGPARRGFCSSSLRQRGSAGSSRRG